MRENPQLRSEPAAGGSSVQNNNNNNQDMAPKVQNITLADTIRSQDRLNSQ